IDQTAHVCFVSPDSVLTGAIARALGIRFESRITSEFQFNALHELREWCDIVLLDLRASSMPGDCEAGLRLMDDWNKIPSHPPMIVLCDGENRSLLFKVMEHGAYDSITNPPNIVELRLILQRAYKFHAAEKELARLRVSARSDGRLHELLGTSTVMQELFALAQKIAPCDVNVLITGETGTGKELLARAIHKMSGRSSGPLVAFSCANLPESLIEDELFGHEKGAFTGALMCRRGRMEAADTGTMFLDEIGDLSLGLQPKLLRVLQERSFERLGSNAKIDVNIRVICATNRNLSDGSGRKVSRRPLLPAECRAIASATFARAARRYFVARATFSTGLFRTLQKENQTLLATGPPRARRIRLAGKRPRTRERGPARCCFVRHAHGGRLATACCGSQYLRSSSV